VLSGLLLILSLLSIGLGGGAAVAAPTYPTIAPDAVKFTPAVTQFNDASSGWSASVEVDVPGDWAFVSGSMTVYDPKGVAHTDWLKLSDASRRVGQLHTLTFTGSIPNEVGGGLNRGYVRAYPQIYYRSTNGSLYYASSSGYGWYHQVVGDTRASLVAPASVTSGSALRLSGEVTCFGAAGYRAVDGGWVEIYYSEPGSGSWTYVGGEPISRATGGWSHTVLSVGATLDWQVRSYPNSNGCDNAVSPTRRVTAGSGEPPAPPPGPGIPGLSVGTVTQHTVALDWSPPTENTAGIIGYRFGWESESGLPQPSWSQVYGVGIDDPFVMTNLCAGCTYSMWVEAVTANGSGDRARVSVTTTAAGTPPRPPAVRRPSPPRALYGRGGNRKAVLRWTAPARTYGARVNWYCVHQYGRRADRCVSGSRRSLVAYGLSNGRVYSFRVRAHTVAGWSGWSNLAHARPHR